MKRSSRLITLAALLLSGAVFLPVADVAAAPAKPLEKIGLVDLQRCIIETVQGTKAKKDAAKPASDAPRPDLNDDVPF